MAETHTGSGWQLLVAAGAACWVEKLVTVEWSYPYCGVRDDSEAAAVHGFPFPYEQSFIAGSASDLFIPWLYVVNLAVIAAGVLCLLRPLTLRFAASNPRHWKIGLGAAATLLLVPAVALDVFALSIGVWRPVSSFAGSPRYRELRPVAFRMLARPRNCTPSPFWFPDRARQQHPPEPPAN
ncbi:MAG TPA: hypothetical protein VFZ34_27215 [Blastocatellia bacterium]|nr:hypothetical protein [Blastocatellia bacterium]